MGQFVIKASATVFPIPRKPNVTNFRSLHQASLSLSI